MRTLLVRWLIRLLWDIYQAEKDRYVNGSSNSGN